MDIDIDFHTDPKVYWEKFPEKVTAWIYYAEHLISKGQIEQAHEIFDEAFTSQKLHRKAKLTDSYAKFVSKFFDYESGQALFDKFYALTDLAGFRDNAINLSTFSDSYLSFLIRHNKLDKAEALLKEQLKPQGKNKPWFRLAELYESRGDYAKSIPIYEQLIDRNQANAEAWKKLRYAERVQGQINNENKVVKSISFTPEYHSAGIAILQNFGSILSKKYPDGGVAFSIEQTGLKVTMIIQHPEGHRETIEDYLNRYGLVVSGQIEPEEYTQDPMELMDLKRQLINFEGEVKWANEKQRMLEGIISKQDGEIDFFKKQLSQLLTENSQLKQNNANLVDNLLTKLNTQDQNLNLLVKQLIKSAENESVEQVINIANALNGERPTIIDKIKEFSFTAIASAGGNAPAWISFLSKVLP